MGTPQLAGAAHLLQHQQVQRELQHLRWQRLWVGEVCCAAKAANIAPKGPFCTELREERVGFLENSAGAKGQQAKRSHGRQRQSTLLSHSEESQNHHINFKSKWWRVVVSRQERKGLGQLL